MADSILVSWHPPKDQSIKVRKYKLGWGKGYPDVEIQVLDGKQRSYAIKPIGKRNTIILSLIRNARNISNLIFINLLLSSLIIRTNNGVRNIFKSNK